MYFERDGRISTAYEISQTVTLRPDLSTADGRHAPCLAWRDVIQDIWRAVTALAENCVTSDYTLDRIAVVRLAIEYPPKGAIEKVIRIPLSCDGPRDLAEKTWEEEPRKALRVYVLGRVARAGEDYCLRQFLDDGMKVARCLHVVRNWGGDDVHEVVVSLNTLAWLAERYGRRVDDFYELHQRPTPLPEDIWPAELDGSDVWFWDRAGNTLIIDDRGRLVEGRTLAERLGCHTLHGPAALSRAREVERERVREAMWAQLRGDEEREAEPEMAEREIPF